MIHSKVNLFMTKIKQENICFIQKLFLVHHQDMMLGGFLLKTINKKNHYKMRFVGTFKSQRKNIESGVQLKY